MSDWPQKFLHAYSERHHYDSVSDGEHQLSLDDAYDIQHQYVKLRKESISGYKAALTAPAAQQAMGVDAPIIGVLFEGGAVDASQPITLGQSVLLETELGFRVADAITAEVTPENVFSHMAACVPMIELASPNLATKPTGLDLIATNSASFQYITGADHDLETMDLDLINISLSREGSTLLQGEGAEVLGGQRHALAWLINETLARDYTISAGAILMTGSIGGIAPAEPGAYEASFGELGGLTFSIST